MVDRRCFIKSALALAGAAVQVRAGMAYALPAGDTNRRLIVVFLRGGMDGLHAFAPVDDPHYPSLRPTLSREVIGQRIPLAGTGFAAHPACAPLTTLFKNGELSFAPCAGTTDTSRSHFQAQDLFELGTGEIHGRSGFMGRLALAMDGDDRAISFTQGLPLSYQGTVMPPEVAPLSGSGLKIPDGRLRDAILKAHRGKSTGLALEQAIETQAEIDAVTGMDPGASRDAAGANAFANMGRRMGLMLRANGSLGLAFVDLGGVDTHVGEEPILHRILTGLSEGMAALRDELGTDEWRHTRLLVMTEFGRTAWENGTKGTDHGHGGLALLAGGDIEGGKVIGGFDGLADNALNQKRDLPVKVDWRDLIGSQASTLFDLSPKVLDQVFPGRPGQPYA